MKEKIFSTVISMLLGLMSICQMLMKCTRLFFAPANLPKRSARSLILSQYKKKLRYSL